MPCNEKAAIIEVKGLTRRFVEVRAVAGVDFAVNRGELFGFLEARTFFNFFRFPMIFLCGLFFPSGRFRFFLRPLSYALPLTYGADMLHGAIHGGDMMSFPVDLAMLAAFCVGLFMLSLRNIRRRWIA